MQTVSSEAPVIVFLTRAAVARIYVISPLSCLGRKLNKETKEYDEEIHLVTTTNWELLRPHKFSLSSSIIHKCIQQPNLFCPSVPFPSITPTFCHCGRTSRTDFIEGF
jgi:hypothetical protein